MVVALAGGMAGTGWADGTHSGRITFINKTNFNVRVQMFNGTDPDPAVPHFRFVVTPGKTKIGKCHARGMGRCNVKITTNGPVGKSKLRFIDDGLTCKIRHEYDDLALCLTSDEWENRRPSPQPKK